MAPEAQNTGLKLPVSAVTILDLGQLERELNSIDDFAIQSAVRSPGQQPKLPKTSRSLEELARLNGVNLLIESERSNLSAALTNLRENAPIVHMSFANDPPSTFLTRIISWFRDEIHPQIFLQIGLQPNIAAGCIVRTSNKQFDFTMRKHFDAHRQLLIDKLIKKEA